MKKLVNSIPLWTSSVGEGARSKHSEYTFTLVSRGKHIFLYAEDEKDYVDWIASIKDIIEYSFSRKE